MAKNETVEIQKELFKEGSKSDKYKALVLGEKGFFKLLKYEWIMGMPGWAPGALGLVLRSCLYPKLLGHSGRNVTFGRGVILRHPRKIFIGDNVVIDDNCVLDAKGSDNRGIFIGDGVFIGRGTVLNCKNGDIHLGDRANIGGNCMIFSASEVRVGRDYLIAAFSYLVGGTHDFEDVSIPVLSQKRSSRGIELGDGGWLGAHVTVLDGVRIGKHAIIGAGAAVHRNIPKYAIAAGNPVTIINKRQGPEAPETDPIPVTVAVINFNGEAVLADTLTSIQNLEYGGVSRILVMDNGSTDSSRDLIQRDFPDVQMMELGENLGPCTARNRAMESADTDWILFVDNDVRVAPDVLQKMFETVDDFPDAGIVSAQVRYADEPDRIQYNGAHIHFAGGAIQNKLTWEKPVQVAAVPGTTILVHREKALAISGFDDDFFFGWEDGDFSFRMTLAGYPTLVAPQALVYHRKGTRGLHWVDFQIRNRWWFILKSYNAWTLLICMPAILIYQLAFFVFLTLKGHFGDYLKGTWSVMRSLPSLLKKRRDFLRVKKLKDRQVLRGGAIDLMGDVDAGGMIKVASGILNIFFKFYWGFAKWLIR